jgi:hypothetical protein
VGSAGLIVEILGGKLCSAVNVTDDDYFKMKLKGVLVLVSASQSDCTPTAIELQSDCIKTAPKLQFAVGLQMKCGPSV